MPAVLLVDDEAAVRAMTARYLSAGGYGIVQAGDGFEAWTYFKRQPFAIDLLVTDVVMPGLSGTELAARVRRVRPELPILLMTGYTPADLLARGLEVTHGAVLTKPFSEAQLIESARHALMGAP